MRRLATCCALLGLAVWQPPPTAAVTLEHLATTCNVPGPAVFCGTAQPVVSPDGRRLAFTDTTTWPPWYEWWPNVVVVSLDAPSEIGRTFPGNFNGWTMAPGWLPDGRLVASLHSFVAGESGLWLADLDASTSPPLTPPTQLVQGDLITTLDVSPSGDRIVYEQAGQLHVVSTHGGPPTALGVAGHSPSWGPDGRIVFSRNDDLWVLDAAGVERPLVTGPTLDRHPDWSPDGAWIAFTSSPNGDPPSTRIWFVRPDGSHLRPMLEDGVLGDTQPHWAPDGRCIVFISERDGSPAVWRASDLALPPTAVEATTWSLLKRRYR